MAVDFLNSWVIGGTTFNFADPYDITRWDADELRYRIPSAEVPDGDGEYQEDSSAEPRIVTLSGDIIGDDADDLRDKWDTFCAAFPKSAAGRLYRHSDRYLNARVQFLRRSEDDGFNHLDWLLAFKCADPYYYSAAAESPLALTTLGAANAITPGGNAEALPVFTLVASGPGNITVAYDLTGKSFGLSIASSGTYIVNAALGTVTKAGADFVSIFTGEFFPLLPTAGNLAITDGSTILTSANVVWTKRWASG